MIKMSHFRLDPVLAATSRWACRVGHVLTLAQVSLCVLKCIPNNPHLLSFVAYGLDGDKEGDSENVQATPLNTYLCSNCIGSNESIDDRYLMFVRCPAEIQDDHSSIESIVSSLASRLSSIEKSQVRIEGRLDTLLDRLEHILPV